MTNTAVEPQRDCLAVLRALYGRDAGVTIVAAAVGRSPGAATLYGAGAHPTVATLSREWIARVGRDPGFAHVAWTPTATVPVTTLDALIAAHGEPAFVKIDVEGYEAEVLRGLSQPIPVLTFEYLPAAVEVAAAAAARLVALGPYRFNVTVGERRRLLWREWRPLEGLEAWLAARHPNETSGDVHARLDA